MKQSIVKRINESLYSDGILETHPELAELLRECRTTIIQEQRKNIELSNKLNDQQVRARKQALLERDKEMY
jgi:hypothetical protein